MDVQLPSGKIIKGVPEGTPKDVIMRKAIAAGIATQEDFGLTGQQEAAPKEPTIKPSDRSSVSLGIERSSNIESQVRALEGAQPKSAARIDEIKSELSILQPQGDVSKIQPLVDELQSLEGQRKDTRAVKELPEITGKINQFLPDLSASAGFTLSAGLLSATDINEQARMLLNADPDIGISQDEQGNLIAANNKTGQQMMINKPGTSAMDVVQPAARMAAFTGSGRLPGVAATVVGGMATEGVLQGVEAAAGGEFNPQDIALEGALTAGTGIALPKLFNYGKLTNSQKSIMKQLDENPLNPDLAKFLVKDGKPQKIALLKKAIDQTGDPALVAGIKGSNPVDRKAAKRMLGIVGRYKQDPMRVTERVGDVVGDSMSKGIIAVKKIADESGASIDKIVKRNLKGKPVDVTQAKANFKDAMANLRVNYNPKTGVVNFKGSALDIKGGGKAKDIISNLAKRLKSNAVNADDVHFAKRLIDQRTSYGTIDSGLSGEAERAVKGLRSDLNQTLKDNFEDYAKANQKYSDAITSIDAIQSAVGQKIDLSNIGALGTRARSFANNTDRREAMIAALDSMQGTLGKYGVKFDGDIVLQARMANAIEEKFKTQGSRALEGIISRVAKDAPDKGITRSLIDKAIEPVQEAFTPNEKDILETLSKIANDNF